MSAASDHLPAAALAIACSASVRRMRVAAAGEAFASVSEKVTDGVPFGKGSGPVMAAVDGRGRPGSVCGAQVWGFSLEWSAGDSCSPSREDAQMGQR